MLLLRFGIIYRIYIQALRVGQFLLKDDSFDL